ncbi:MAG: hypothetical protein KGI72_00620 [Patescibacteria group bacterium]|nr:hypothetical protein [Patescibacteria group bacterium]
MAEIEAVSTISHAFRDNNCPESDSFLVLLSYAIRESLIKIMGNTKTFRLYFTQQECDGLIATCNHIKGHPPSCCDLCRSYYEHLLDLTIELQKKYAENINHGKRVMVIIREQSVTVCASEILENLTLKPGTKPN